VGNSNCRCTFLIREFLLLDKVGQYRLQSSVEYALHERLRGIAHAIGFLDDRTVEVGSTFCFVFDRAFSDQARQQSLDRLRMPVMGKRLDDFIGFEGRLLSESLHDFPFLFGDFWSVGHVIYKCN
jgi:hypothetical protein